MLHTKHDEEQTDIVLEASRDFSMEFEILGCDISFPNVLGSHWNEIGSIDIYVAFGNAL